MNALKSWIKQYTFVTFVILSCALSWWMTPLGLEGLPTLPVGPLLAALIVILVTKGRKGLREWRRISLHWRVAPQWYVVAIAFPIVMNAAAAGVNILLGASVSTAVWSISFIDWFVEAIFTFIVVAVGEEMGFSGFGLPHLLHKHSILATALILGLVRVLWHVPLFMVGETGWPVALLLIPAQVVFTWIFVGSRGSAFLIILAHGSMATVAYNFFTAMFSGPDLSRQVWLQVAMFTLTAVAVLITSKTMRSVAPLTGMLAEEVDAPAVVIP
jgi:uncharacterized protein